MHSEYDHSERAVINQNHCGGLSLTANGVANGRDLKLSAGDKVVVVAKLEAPYGPGRSD